MNASARDRGEFGPELGTVAHDQGDLYIMGNYYKIRQIGYDRS